MTIKLHNDDMVLEIDGTRYSWRRGYSTECYVTDVTEYKYDVHPVGKTPRSSAITAGKLAAADVMLREKKVADLHFFNKVVTAHECDLSSKFRLIGECWPAHADLAACNAFFKEWVHSKDGKFDSEEEEEGMYW